MGKIKIGIIGGSGFYNMEELKDPKEVDIDTEFGKPTGKPVTGTLNGVDCVVLARHGPGHKVNPTNVNYRANIRALQKLEVTHILAATACGSLKEEMAPGDFVVLDSFIDRTTKRPQTLHDGSGGSNFGSVCHIPMSDPFCPKTREIVFKSGVKALEGQKEKMHNGGTMVTIEGPRFSTKAESKMFRQWGGEVINMTTVPEVVLANEAGIAYISVAMVTDYDCWREGEEAVDVAKVMAQMKSNVINVQKVILASISEIAKENWDETIAEHQARAKGSVMA